MIKVTILWILVAVILINKSNAQNCQQTGCTYGNCCSKWGFCGNSPLHCVGSASLCQPPCGPGVCCSKWGFCGNSPLHCEGGGGGQTNDTSGNICQPPCGPSFCCSRWGFCGNTPLHCAGGGQTNNTSGGNCQPPCGAGSCCSQWGFCGNSPLHCAGGGGTTTPPNTVSTPSTTSSPNTVSTPSTTSSANTVSTPSTTTSANTISTSSTTSSPNTVSTTSTTSSPNTVSTPSTTSSPTTVSTTISSVQCPPPCPIGFCCSNLGYCSSTASDCDPQPTNGTGETTMTRARFDCIFDQLDPALRDKRWQGYQDALTKIPFNPQNQDELMMFFAHVSHETDGLQTYEEYCAQAGTCADDYQNSWCQPVQAEPGKQYYGRGWFQLSYPCNYNAAGKAIGVDLLKNPDLVAESDTWAAATAMWFWNANNMGQPARNGNFAGTTQKINSIECGPTPQQTSRIDRYQRVRACYGLSPETDNLRC